MPALLRVVCLTSLAAVLAGCAGAPTTSNIGQQFDDTAITSKVKAAFLADRAVSVLNIAVETFRGTVHLSGFASNQTEISRAVELSSDVNGVRSVKNDIRLKNGD